MSKQQERFNESSFKIVELREEGLTFTAIGKQLGVSRQYVNKKYNEYMKRNNKSILKKKEKVM